MKDYIDAIRSLEKALNDYQEPYKKAGMFCRLFDTSIPGEAGFNRANVIFDKYIKDDVLNKFDEVDLFYDQSNSIPLGAGAQSKEECKYESKEIKSSDHPKTIALLENLLVDIANYKREKSYKLCAVLYRFVLDVVGIEQNDISAVYELFDKDFNYSSLIGQGDAGSSEFQIYPGVRLLGEELARTLRSKQYDEATLAQDIIKRVTDKLIASISEKEASCSNSILKKTLY